jgi:5,10-methylenetetrahydrofolate reductase
MRAFGRIQELPKYLSKSGYLRKSRPDGAAGLDESRASAALTITVSEEIELEKLARKIRRALRSGAVSLAGEFSRIKTIYSQLAGILAWPESARLARLCVPLIKGRPDLVGLPANRAERRIAKGFSRPSFPLEHLLLAGDFPDQQGLLATLFPAASSGLPDVRFNDPKGSISIGQHRDTLSVVVQIGSNSAAAPAYTAERWADYSTFCPAVRISDSADVATIDVAQLEGQAEFRTALAAALEAALTTDDIIALDSGFVRYDQTCAWRFNQAFWRFLGVWERVTGKDYQRALPKGKSESHHAEFIAEAAENFASHIRELEREGALAPQDELWFHEEAPGSGEFTAGLLDHFRQYHQRYYSRLRVVLSDVSEQVLALAARELEKRGHLNAGTQGPEIFLRDLSISDEPAVRDANGQTVSLEGRLLYFRHANFLDQLPTRLFAKRAERFKEVYVQAVISRETLQTLEQRHGSTLSELLAVIEGQVDLNTRSADEQKRTVGFWSDVWSAMKFRESHRAIDNFAAFHPRGAALAHMLRDHDDVRFVSSDVAIDTTLSDMQLLHREHGYACFTDILLQRVDEFHERWIELAKYDNGVWVGTNAVLMTELLASAGYETGYYPVELTLGEPTPVYTLTVRRREATEFLLSADTVQQLTGIERLSLQDISLAGLPRRIRNNLRELPGQFGRLRIDRDWSSRLTPSLGLSALLRELYYHSSLEMTERSPFIKLVALIAELLCRHPERPVTVEPEIAVEELKDLEDFLEHRPINNLPMDLVEASDRGEAVFVLRLPTLARRLEAGRFVVLAEVDLPRSQSAEQLRRRLLQFQAPVDAISITSGRLADPRFLRGSELLELRLLEALQPDRLVMTIEMRDRQAPDLERDLDAFEARGVRNFFILTGDFELSSRWWLDSLHGIQIADRLRNEDVNHSPGIRSRTLIAGAMAWSGIPDLRARVERDVILKLRAGADVLFTQPVYDLRRASEALEVVSRSGLDRVVHIVPELLPIVTIDQMRTLRQAPGIVVPNEMAAAYAQIVTNVEKFCRRPAHESEDARRDEFVEELLRGVPAIPGYEDVLTAELAATTYAEMSRAIDSARRKSTSARESAQALRAARESVLFEVAFALTQRAMAVLCGFRTISGFLIVARNGRELRRLAAEARRMGTDRKR